MIQVRQKLKPRSPRWFGWDPDLPDARDKFLLAPVNLVRPAKVDLTAGCPPVYDQGALGSCTANAIAAALEFDQKKQTLEPVFVPSRLFIYYNERALEGTIREDAGAQIRDGFKTVAKQGAPHEALWPYVISRFAAKPNVRAYRDAAKHPAILYQRLVQTPAMLETCLAGGFPFVFGFTVYDSFESDAVASSGTVPMPGPSEEVLGGHAVLCVGYDQAAQRFLVRNSWGPGWGTGGYFTMPYAYLTDVNLADDFWTVTLVQ
jgi:C1A family cysteine protease